MPAKKDLVKKIFDSAAGSVKQKRLCQKHVEVFLNEFTSMFQDELRKEGQSRLHGIGQFKVEEGKKGISFRPHVATRDVVGLEKPHKRRAPSKPKADPAPKSASA